MKDTFKKILCDAQSIRWFAYAVVSFSFILGFTTLFNLVLGFNLSSVTVNALCLCVIIVTRVIEHASERRLGVYSPNLRATCAYLFGLVLVTVMFTVVNL